MSKPPIISVLLSVYNASQYITDAIQSILSQSFSDFELIIINDGSSDSTMSLLGTFQDSRIIILNIPHSGLTKALNRGLQIAKGEFIARMDADDIALPKRFESQVVFLKSNPEIAAVGTAYEVITESGSRRPATVPLLSADETIRHALPKFNPFHHSSMMIRRHILSELGGYDEKFEMAQDYDLWLRISKKHKLANLNDVLMLRREGVETLRKERKQNWYGIQARVKAIKTGDLRWATLIFLIRPFLVIAAPDWIKKIIRKTIRGQHG